MPYAVLLLPKVAEDLEELFDYIALHDAPENAVHVVTKIYEQIYSLAEFPNRGTRVKLLAETGYAECREVAFKPYRIFYRVIGEAVRVYLVADGRRDFGDLLTERLLSG